MADKKETFAENSEQMFEETLGKLEAWFLKNQKIITAATVAVVILIGGYFGYHFLYQMPREKSAQDELFFAQDYFEIDSLDLALNGDGAHYGMIDVIGNYGGTDAANLAHYYIGVIYLKKGQYQEAINYLEKFKSEDLILAPMTKSLLGDCFAELGDMNEAMACYKSAIASHPNDMVTPMVLMKAAALCQVQNDYKQALDFYTRVRNEFVRSMEARDIDKYIAMMEAKINQ
ncbi:MAG: tetratricopeptide repeat protein [Bacteroidales bacterium]|jgi:predicted negative regulator of RcsB-dependent stress response|nr:tetratricopeptide repeat protein [Bacteroidales bacterium]